MAIALSQPAFSHALRLAEDPSVDARRLGRALEQDPALARFIIAAAEDKVEGRVRIRGAADAVIYLGHRRLLPLLRQYGYRAAEAPPRWRRQVRYGLI